MAGRNSQQQTPPVQGDQFDPVDRAMVEHLVDVALDNDGAGRAIGARREQPDLFRSQARGRRHARPCAHEVRVEDVRAANEIGDETRPRPLIDIRRRADLNDAPLVEHRDAIRHRKGFALVVGDEDEGKAKRALQCLEFALHVLAKFEVERAERFVEQQDLGPDDQRAGEGDPLPLAAGQLAGLALFHPEQLDHLELFGAQLVAFRLAHAADHQAIANVVEHVHVREQSIVLKDRVHRPPIGRDALDRFPEDPDVARGRLIEPGDQPKARRLAGAGRTEHCKELARRDVEIDAVDRPHRSEMTLDAAKRNSRKVGEGRTGRHV